MNIKQIEDELNKLSQTDLTTLDFIRAISNQIIDEMIGEERDENAKVENVRIGGAFNGDIPVKFEEDQPTKGESVSIIRGYNVKVQELKEYKERFNN